MEGIQSFEELLEDYLPEISEKGDILEGTIIRKDKEFAYLDIKGKLEGKLKVEEVAEFKEGDKIKVLVLNDDKDSEYTRVSRRLIELNENWEIIKKAYENSEKVKGIITKKVNGGYIVEIYKYMSFMPNSLSLIKDEEEESFVGKEIEAVIKDLKDGKRKKIIISRKELVMKKEEEFLEDLEINKEIEGTVREILNFGMVVEIGAVAGFVHISEIAWKKVNDINEIYKIGDKVNVKVIDIDREKKSIKLSIKQLKEDPWINFAEKNKVDDELEASIIKIEKFGAFAEVEEGIDGLIHISDLSWSKKIKDIKEYINLGDKVKVKIIEMDSETKKLKLGLKQLSIDPWNDANDKYAIGNTVDAKIVDIKDFGLFAEIEEGVDIFVHVSDYSWLKSEAKSYKIGDLVKIVVLEIDMNERKIKGGIKQLEKSPWELVLDKYKVGQKIKRKISNITEFGLFIEIEKGIDGMIHISEASKDYIQSLDKFFKSGDEIEAEIIEIDGEKQKIKLSIKKIELEEEKKENDNLIEKYGETKI